MQHVTTRQGKNKAEDRVRRRRWMGEGSAKSPTGLGEANVLWLQESGEWPRQQKRENGKEGGKEGARGVDA